MNHATRQRIRVLQLRVQLERTAAGAYDQVCRPDIVGQQNKITTRLLYVLAGVPEADFPQARQVVQRARHVYRQTSGVMHGHLGLIDLPDAVVDEWEQIVVELQAIASGCAPGRSVRGSRRAT